MSPSLRSFLIRIFVSIPKSYLIDASNLLCLSWQFYLLLELLYIIHFMDNITRAPKM